MDRQAYERIAHVRCCLALAPASATASSVKSRVGADEWRARVELAAAYRVAGDMGWSEHIYNHVTCRAGEREGAFLINPFGLRFCEVTASSLVTIDLDGNVLEPGSTDRGINLAGFVIHSAVHRARPDLACVFHNHANAVVAVASQHGGFMPVSQEACIVWPRVSRRVHAFEGVATDLAEQQRILDCLGPAAHILFMQNHGVLVGGTSVAGAFWSAFVVCRACELQCAALASVGGDRSKLVLPSQSVVDGTGARVQAGLDKVGAVWGQLEFEAVLRRMREECPEFES
eukprot:g7869.t1